MLKIKKRLISIFLLCFITCTYIPCDTLTAAQEVYMDKVQEKIATVPGIEADSAKVTASSAEIIMSSKEINSTSEITSTSGKKSRTIVAGLKKEITADVKSSVKDTIFVASAYGRTVKLQRYYSSSKEWKDIKKYTAGSGECAKVKLAYPSEYWNKYKKTKWRVYIPATDDAASYTSPTITIITQNREDLTLSCKSALVMNVKTGNVYYNKSMDKKLPQASLTKIMTCILAMEKNSLDAKVSISENAADTPWSYIPLIKGDKIYVKDLLYSAMLRSSNGSAVALAEKTGKTEKKFAGMMNEKAEEIGCQNTNYVNPHGLDAKNHYSTAYDTALITQYAWNNKTFRKIIKTQEYSFKTLVKKKSCTVKTTNQLLGTVEGMEGGKTGTTSGAGDCFSGIYTYEDQSYVIVVMGSENDTQRWADAKKLIQYVQKYGW